MRYYPVNLDILDRKCLVVGGGAVGTRKVNTLLKCGASVTVVSHEISDRLVTLAETLPLTLEKRDYRESDLTGMFLVIGATDDEALNFKIYEDAEKRGMLVNIADRPAVCNFVLPSIVHRGDLTVSISTSGKSPAMARKLRKDLEGQFGPEYAGFLDLMGRIRKRLLAEAHEPEVHKPLFERLIAGGLLDLSAAGDAKKIDALLYEVLGEGFTYAELMAP